MHTIYLLTNRVNGKQYVGQTKFSATVRWRSHVWCARTGNGFCRKLNNAIRKHGPNSFLVETIVRCPSWAADDYERMFIELYDTCRCGYNIQMGQGYKSSHALETRALMSTAQRNSKAVHVLQWRLDGTFVKEFECIRDAARAVGAWEGAISLCTRGGYDGKYKSVAGFLWTTTAEPPPPRAENGRAKKVAQFDLNGKLMHVFPSAGKAAIAIGRTQTAISACATGRSKHCGGFVWNYV